MVNNKRIDQHRPSAILTDEYEYVGQECMRGESLGDCRVMDVERQRIREHMARTGGTYSRHEHGGNCMVCGSVHAIYTILFYYHQNNTYIRMGADCATKCEMSGDYDVNAFRRAIQDARQAQAGKAKAQLILTDAGLTKCWTLYTAMNEPLCDCEIPCNHLSRWENQHKAEQIIGDIVGKLVKYGNLSDKQLKFLRKLLVDIDEREARDLREKEERKSASDCPTGRIKIEGEVLGVKTVDTEWGLVTKLLVKHATGYKVWGSQPARMNAEKGDQIKFTATVTPSPDDSKFGFYKRPWAA